MGEELSDRMQEAPEEKQPTAEDIRIITEFLQSDTERFNALNEQVDPQYKDPQYKGTPHYQPKLRIVPRPDER